MTGEGGGRPEQHSTRDSKKGIAQHKTHAGGGMEGGRGGGEEGEGGSGGELGMSEWREEDEKGEKWLYQL